MKIKSHMDIFIVDDNKIFSIAIKAYLENEFNSILIKVHLFETGEKCMLTFMDVIPELVILDYQLNSNSPLAMNGLQVLNKIKHNNIDTRVIMLTSNDHIDTALQSFHYGASDYVVKTENPFRKINDSISKIFAKIELDFEIEEKGKRAIELIIANKELDFDKERSIRNEEKEIQNKEINLANSQKKEAEIKQLTLERKNKDITDSINYAKRIQMAKLPKQEEIYSELSNCFILFKPKDIVSGDFYFFHKKSDSIFIAAADCTGHGVPGAFMSIIGSDKLDAAIAYSSNISEILNHLNKGIKNSLNQTGSNESTRDGMDIALCSVDTKNGTVTYAGANRPFWLIRNNTTELKEIKGTNKAIGGLTVDEQHFDSHELRLQSGDTFYISTDGYADQFGGLAGKKLMSKKLKKTLIEIQDKSMPEQKEYLNTFLENWKGEQEQVDDILIIGVRF